MNAVII